MFVHIQIFGYIFGLYLAKFGYFTYLFTMKNEKLILYVVVVVGEPLVTICHVTRSAVIQCGQGER